MSDDLKDMIIATIVFVNVYMLDRAWCKIDYVLLFSIMEHTLKSIDKGHNFFLIYLTITVINLNVSSLFSKLLNIKMCSTFYRHPIYKNETQNLNLENRIIIEVLRAILIAILNISN